jgi:DNA-binding PadR family transcriptional regulator
MLKKYLNALAEKGLIDLSNSEANGLCRVTEKGKEFIRHYRQMVDLMTNRQLKTPALISSYNNYIPNIHEIM